MKRFIFEANLEERGCSTTLVTILLVLTWGLRYFWKRGASEKGCVEIEDCGTSVHFVLGFQENSIYTLHLRFSYDITKWCKVYTKTNSWFQKSHEEFGQLQKNCGSPKVEIRWATFVQKNTFLQLKHDIQGIYLTLLSTTYESSCENSTNSSCHFWTHQSFFMTQLLGICLAQIPHTFYKSNLSKCKFSDFPLLALKFTKLLSFFPTKSQFFFKVRIILQCHER